MGNANAPTRRGSGAGKRAKTAAKAKAAPSDWPYRFELVPLDRLTVDIYQRPLTSFVDEVTNQYDPALVGSLIVSERDDGTMSIIDGQTRAEGMRRNAEPLAPCLVYTGLTRENEAELFARLQTARRGMATYLRFRASLIAKNPEAVAIAEIVQGQGFDLDIEMTPHTVKAIGALERVYRRDPALLTLTLGTIQSAWPDPATEYRTAGDVIGGLAVFLGREERVDHRKLVEKLSAVTPRIIRHRANALKEGSGSGGGSPGYIADAILGIYMRGKPRADAA